MLQQSSTSGPLEGSPPPTLVRRQHPSIGGPSSLARPDSAGHQGSATTTSDDSDKERCPICLMDFNDPTAAGECGHMFCFKCIGVWANQSRRCPLCNNDLAAVLLHDLDSGTPTKFFLPPLPDRQRFPIRSRLRTPQTDTREAEYRAHVAEMDALARAIDRRRDIYARNLWAKHIASNQYTRFRPNPTPQDVASDPQLSERTLAFLLRELRIWTPPDDVPQIADHLLETLQAVDIRSEAAVRIFSIFVGDTYPDAPEHLAHELYTYLRSPCTSLEEYDSMAQYDAEPSSPLREMSRTNWERGRSTSSRSLSTIASEQPYSRSPHKRRGRSLSSERSWSPSSRDSRHYSRSRSPDRERRYSYSSAARERRWDQSDSWVDPAFSTRGEGHRSGKRRRSRRSEQRARAREKKRIEAEQAGAVEKSGTGNGEQRGVELLPEEGNTGKPMADRPAENLTIKGAAERRQILLERLAKAKARQSMRTKNPKSRDAAHPEEPTA